MQINPSVRTPAEHVLRASAEVLLRDIEGKEPGIMDKMTRHSAKVILADELNEAAAQMGMAATLTPEQISAIASANLRKQQKKSKKSKRK